MAKSRLDKTLGDYVVIALSPALIMTLVGSLVFFLLEVSYRGQYATRMHWILFWFVFGAVLVARIAIEEGKEHARLFGVVLCGAVGFAAMRFIDDAVLIAWVLLAIVWWCSSKLTWDCTLIDESEDASGEGLLQAAGFNSAEQPDSAADAPDKVSKAARNGDEASPFNDAADDSISDESEGGKARPHAPGLWVVYFSLAALPLFGAGQLLIPAAEAGRRSYAFQLLAVYVASALALLLTTSFLGLRRYLRQRKLEMSPAMTRGWLGMGTVLLVALLLLALLIPRPQGEYTLTAMIDKLDAKLKQASKFAFLKNDKGQGEGRQIGDPDPQAKQPGDARQQGQGQPGGQGQGNAPQGKPGEQDGKGEAKPEAQAGEQQQGQNPDKSGQQGDNKSDKPGQQPDPAGQPPPKDPQGGNPQQPPDQAQQAQQQQQQAGQAQQPQQPNPGQPPQQADKAQQARNDQAQKAQQPNQAQQQQQQNQAQKPQEAAANKPPPPPPPVPSATNLMGLLASMVKWILYGVLILVGLYLLRRHWAQIVDFLARLWAELLSLFGFKPKPSPDNEEEKQKSVVRDTRPFASFVNPYASGAAGRMSPPQLVRYTFEALEAWSREQVVERPPSQTPLEFADELGRRVPTLAQDVAQTAQLYMHIAYSRKTPSRDRLDVLERLWRQLSS